METLTVSPHLFTATTMMKPLHSPAPSTAPPMTQPMAPSPMIRNRRAWLSSPRLNFHAGRDELLCRYPSKMCDNLRSEKRGGGLHRFCAEHRERANINQRRVDQRRRMRRRGGGTALYSPIERKQNNQDHFEDVHSSEDDEDAHALDDQFVSLDLDVFSGENTHEPLCMALSEDDLRVLLAILDHPVTSAQEQQQPRSIAVKEEPMRY